MKQKPQGEVKRTIWDRLPIAALVVLAVGLLAKILVTEALRDRIIIEYGVRTFNSATQVTSVVIILGLAMMVGSLIYAIRLKLWLNRAHRQELEQKRQQAKVVNDFAEDSPEATRQMLEQFRKRMPVFDKIATKCLSKMDEVDDLQRRQAFLIEANAASYLNDTVEALNDVERRICRNMRSIMNVCIATSSRSELDQDKILRFFEDNEQKLQAARELLRVSTEWIDSYDGENVGDLGEVKKWIETIRNNL